MLAGHAGAEAGQGPARAAGGRQWRGRSQAEGEMIFAAKVRLPDSGIRPSLLVAQSQASARFAPNMKPLRIILAGCTVVIALLMAIVFAFSFAAPSPEDAAKASAIGKGWHQEQLSLLRSQTTNSLFGGTAHVEFTAPIGSSHASKIIRVDLMRPVYSSNWRISAYEEAGPPFGPGV